MVNKIKITLLQEEINSLLSFGEVSVHNDDSKEIIIKLEINEEENILRENILDRYNNEEYWDREILIK
jgi:hypothetical protein